MIPQQEAMPRRKRNVATVIGEIPSAPKARGVGGRGSRGALAVKSRIDDPLHAALVFDRLELLHAPQVEAMQERMYNIMEAMQIWSPEDPYDRLFYRIKCVQEWWGARNVESETAVERLSSRELFVALPYDPLRDTIFQ